VGKGFFAINTLFISFDFLLWRTYFHTVAKICLFAGQYDVEK